jgi:pimeloyl-ACP methyl ester carboxylesterase
LRSLAIGSTQAPRGPLLLVPGNDLCDAFYRPLGEALAARNFAVRLLTLPGFHGTPALPSPGWRALLDALGSQIDTCFPTSGTLVGHSLGGLAAMVAAAERPERIARLVLLEPAIITSAFTARMAAKKYARDVVTGARDRFVNWSGSFHRVHDLSAYPEQAIDLYLEVRRTTPPEVSLSLLEDVPSLYPLPFDRVRAPALILRGASSGLLARFGIERLALKLPRAQTQVIAGAAHWMANEQDEAIAEAITSFFDRT